MSRISSVLCIVILSVLVTGAFSPVHAEPGKPIPSQGRWRVLDAAGPLASTEPALARAEIELRKAEVARDRAFYSGNADHFLSFYADDVVSFQPGKAELVGKDAVSEGVEEFLANYHVDGKLTVKRVTVSGDYATRQAEWDETWTANDGSAAFRQVGRCFVSWRKINGEWKVVSEFTQYVVPPTDLAVDVK
jgi:uncharacterized protein (TIGR02246 family)